MTVSSRPGPPNFHLWTHARDESRDAVTAVIRARAREQGAVVRTETAAELALRKAREAQAAHERHWRERGPNAVAEVRTEVETIFGEIGRILERIHAGGVADSRTAWYGNICGITSGAISTSLVWMQRAANNVQGSLLRVNEWDAPLHLPGPQNPQGGGRNHIGAVHFAPTISPDDLWVWRHEREHDEGSGVGWLRDADTLYRAPTLADVIVRRHVERVYTN
jgi:hypothetical protein